MSAGNLFAYGLDTDTTSVQVLSAGNGFVTVNNLLEATIASVGSLYYKGNPVIHSSITSLGRLINAN